MVLLRISKGFPYIIMVQSMIDLVKIEENLAPKDVVSLKEVVIYVDTLKIIHRSN